MNKLLTNGQETQKIVKEVVDLVCKAVVSTMGPNGRLAMISSGHSTKTTKDGVTVAKSIKFDDPLKELVNRVITEPAIKTDVECGDGTTTTIMLTGVLHQAFSEMSSFVEQRELEKIVSLVIEELTNLSIKIGVDDERLYRMALTSANQDVELAKLVTDIYKEGNGKFPDIELKEGTVLEDKVQRIEGRALKMYYSNPVFGKGQQGGELEIDFFTPVVIDNRLAYPDPAKLHALLDQVILSETHERNYPLVIIARSIEQDYISEFVGWCNKNKHLYKDGVPAIIAMNTNMGGSIGTSEMQDLAVMLNAPFITDINDLDKVDLRGNTCTLRLGSTRSHLTELTGTDEQRIEDQAKLIEKTLAEFSFSDRFSLRARINERRIRNLRSEMVTIHVGGETNSEIKERIDRYEDVVKAVRSGLENGILPGGGIALMRATAEAVKRYRRWNLPQGVDPQVAQKEKEPYIQAAVTMAMAPRHQLFSGTMLDEYGVVHFSSPNTPESCLYEPHILDLASGRIDTPENLGVYDTAYASITALKGGLQTAKLLANTDTLILGDKIHAVKVP